MGLENRKAALREEIEREEAALRRKIERKERYLETLEAMPEFDALEDGTILALTVTYGRSAPYPVVAYNGGGRWYLTGEKSPNGVTGDELAEWLMSGGRHLRTAEPIATFTIQRVAPPVFDLGEAMLSAMREFPGGRFGIVNTYDESSGRGL
jgi:hypothetical protein